jgi:chromosome segregation ATPase
MADEPDDKEPKVEAEVVHEEVTVEPKADKVDPLPNLEHLTPKHLEALKRELRDEIAELHSSDKEEREELKRQLAELNEYKAKQETAQAERDKVEASQHTMVLPPSDIPPQQPNPNESTKGEPGEGGKKRRLSWW